jgi:hypothetical protein
MGGTALQLNTFEIKEFGGLATGAPRGSATLGFRVLDGFTHKGLVGGLTIAPTKILRFIHNENITRFFNIWDDDINAVKIVAQGNATIDVAKLYQIPDRYTLVTGTDPGKIMKGWRGKIVFLNSNGIKDLNLGGQNDYQTQLITFIGDYNTKIANSLTLSMIAVGTDGQLNAGIWSASVLPMRVVAIVGTDRFYIPSQNPGSVASVQTTITAAKEHIEISWTGADALEINIQSSTTFYYAGFFKSSPAIIKNVPLENADYGFIPYQFSSRVKAEAIAYRNNRTWVAKNAIRDYSIEKNRLPSTGIDVLPPNQTATIYFSSTGKPWTFPVENFITLSIKDNITALCTLSNALLVFSKSEIWAITGNSDADFVAFKIPGANPGCISDLGVQEWRDVVFYVAPDGVYKVNLNGCENVSLPIRDVFLNMGANPVVSTGIDRFRNEFLLALNGILYVLDLEKNVWLTRGTANFVEGGDIVMVANDATVSSFDGNSNSTAVFQTEWLDMDAPEMDKFFRQIRLAVENPTGFDCTVTVQPIKFDGTLLTAPATQTVNAGAKARLNFGLKGQGMVGRGLAFRVTVTGLPGVVIRPDMTIEWRALGTRGR